MVEPVIDRSTIDFGICGWIIMGIGILGILQIIGIRLGVDFGASSRDAEHDEIMRKLFALGIAMQNESQRNLTHRTNDHAANDAYNAFLASVEKVDKQYRYKVDNQN